MELEEEEEEEGEKHWWGGEENFERSPLAAQPTLRLQKCSGKPFLTFIWGPLKGTAELGRCGMDEAQQSQTRDKSQAFHWLLQEEISFQNSGLI